MSSKHFKQLTIETISQKKTNECRIFTDVGLVVFVALLLLLLLMRKNRLKPAGSRWCPWDFQLRDNQDAIIMVAHFLTKVSICCSDWWWLCVRFKSDCHELHRLMHRWSIRPTESELRVQVPNVARLLLGLAYILEKSVLKELFISPSTLKLSTETGYYVQFQSWYSDIWQLNLVFTK